MSMTKKSLKNLVVRSALTLLTWAALACGGDNGGNTPDDLKPDAGTNTTPDAKAPAVIPDSSTGGSDASKPSGSGGDGGGNKPMDAGAAGSLFARAPACDATSGSRAKVEGKLSTFDVDFTNMTFSSDLISGSIQTLDREGDANLHYLSLAWVGGGLQPGEVHALTGNFLTIPDASTRGSGPFCVVAGEIASLPASDAPSVGATLVFHVTKIKARSSRDTNGATCDGPELDADLRGCIYRTNSFLPPNN